MRRRIGGSISEFSSLIAPLRLEDRDTWELSVYVQDQWVILPGVTAGLGARATSYSGEAGSSSAVDPRFSLVVALGEETRLYTSLVTISQFVHPYRNSGVFMLYPPIFWYPSTETVKPSTAIQATLGIQHGMRDDAYALGAESFYRSTHNLHGFYAVGAAISSASLTDALLFGTGRSYGVELSARKRTGSLRWSASYTLSWADEIYAGIQGGEPFPSPFDRRHEIHPIPDLVKIDIDGGEVLALPGMRRLLQEARPVVLMELHGPQAAQVVPAQFMKFMADRIAERGVETLSSTKVTGWALRNGKIDAVKTSAGEIEADEFVIAGGSWSPGLVRDLGIRLPLQAGKGYSLTIAQPKAMPRRGLIFGEAHIAVTPMMGTLRIGGTMEVAGFDESVNPARVRGIVKSATRVLPDYAPDSSCSRPTTPSSSICAGNGRLLAASSLRHSYPHCWRHKTPVIFRATPQWFLSLDQAGLRDKAVAYVEQVDKERQEWTRFLFGVDWNDSQLYDVVLNLSRLDLESASETVVNLTRRDEFRATAESLKAMQNLTLQSRVAAVLATDYRTRDTEVEVTAADGIVTITGTTRWPEVERAVPAVVRRVEGVKEVHSQVFVPIR